MIRSLSIHNLRGIRSGKIEQLCRLVILVGPNSSGKSTVLDAILLAASPSPQQTVNQLLQRRPGLNNAQRWLIWRSGEEPVDRGEITIQTDAPPARTVEFFRMHAGNFDSPIQVSTRYEAGSPQTATSTPPPPVPQRIPNPAPIKDVPSVRLIDPDGAAPQQPLHAIYTEVAERNLRRQAKAILTDLLPEIEDIEILSLDNQPVVYLVYSDGARPVALAGDGIKLLLRQSLELAAPVGGVVLLEEPEVHMHPGAIRQSARAMLAATRRGIQVIVTTHSLDLIDALIACTEGDELNHLCLYQLKLDMGRLTSHRLSGPEIAMARTQIEDDLR